MASLSDWLKPELIWFVIGLILLLLEFAAPGIVIFFFGVGAWLVALLCFLIVDLALEIQLFTFLVSSVLLLVLFRGRVKSMFQKDGEYENLADTVDQYKGKKVTVVKTIRPEVPGKVEFQGSHWNAEADEVIEPETVVEIVAKNNITLKVKPI